MNIAVVVAHPDDAEYIVGGTIAKYTNKGHKVTIIICTNGNIGHPDLSREEIEKIRLKEAKEGAKILSAEVVFLGYDDEFFPDSRESRLKLLNELRKVNPSVVFTHHPNDYTNADHRVVSNVAIDMSYLQMMKNIKTTNKKTDSFSELYYIDIPGGVGFEPTEYVDISDVFELKMKALSKHKTQQENMVKIGAAEKNSFLRNVEVQAAFRGLQYQCKYAEAFISINKYPRAVSKKNLPQYI